MNEMATTSKQITLRAFKIDNPNLTEPHSDILEKLQQVLTETSTAADRRMPLNQNEPDRDLLSDFEWTPNHKYLFGMILRIIPAENGGVLEEEMFRQRTITISQISAGNPGQSQYKDHFYFAINNEYLVANIPGNLNVDRFQTFINWLLQEVRGDRLYRFTELTKVPDGIKLSDIREIQFVGGGTVVATPSAESAPTTIKAKLGQLSDDILRALLGETSDLSEIRNNRLIEANLLLRVKGKPKELAENEFKRIMGAIATNVTNDSGIIIKTKDGNKYTGEAVKVKKRITVDCVGPNQVVEEQLKQNMELFLGEIRSRQNG